MCVSTCQGCPANWKVNTDTSPNSATAKIRRVESAFPAARHDNVAASAIATINPAGSIQSVPRIMPKATATISAPGRTSSDNVAVAMKLAASNAVAFSQEGHRHDGIAFAGVIQQEYGAEANCW